MVDMKVRDDHIIQLLAAEHTLNIGSDRVGIDVAVPVCFASIKEERFTGRADDQGGITLADVDMVDFQIARGPRTGAACAGGCLSDWGGTEEEAQGKA
jgi:hypothetical protein